MSQLCSQGRRCRSTTTDRGQPGLAGGCRARCRPRAAAAQLRLTAAGAGKATRSRPLGIIALSCATLSTQDFASEEQHRSPGRRTGVFTRPVQGSRPWINDPLGRAGLDMLAPPAWKPHHALAPHFYTSGRHPNAQRRWTAATAGQRSHVREHDARQGCHTGRARLPRPCAWGARPAAALYGSTLLSTALRHRDAPKRMCLGLSPSPLLSPPACCTSINACSRAAPGLSSPFTAAEPDILSRGNCPSAQAGRWNWASESVRVSPARKASSSCPAAVGNNPRHLLETRT